MSRRLVSILRCHRFVAEDQVEGFDPRGKLRFCRRCVLELLGEPAPAGGQPVGTR